MASLPRHAARLVGLDGLDAHAARSILGTRHPLTLALSRRHVVAKQLCVTLTVLVVGLGVAVLDIRAGELVLGAAAIVAGALTVALAIARRVVRDRVDDLIASGDDAVLVAPVIRRRRQLASAKERERLARSLERLLRDARRWNEILPQFRPLPGVQCLRDTVPEAQAVIALLRSERVAVHGVALVARLLGDGVTSPLYGGDARRLREELNRIRYILASDAPRRAVEVRRAA